MTDFKIQDKKYYPYMDGFRAIAAFWVMLHHMFIFFNFNRMFDELNKFSPRIFSIDLKLFFRTIENSISSLASCGKIGVDMFFVISGFLITGLLLEHLEAGVDIKRFYIRRFFKIIPQYLFAVIFVAILYIFVPPFYILLFNVPGQLSTMGSSHANGAILWHYFFFLQNYSTQVPMLAHSWSLVIEEHFYFFYPIVMWVVCKTQHDVINRRKVMIYLCFFIIILCNFIRYRFASGIPCLNIFFSAPLHFQTTLFRFDALGIGCLIKLYEPQITGKNRLLKFIAPFSFLAGLFIYVLFYLKKLTVGGYLTDTWYSYTLAYLAASFIFISAMRRFEPLNFIVENPTLRFIGRNSYGIYLWHYILLFSATIMMTYLGISLSVIIYVFSAVFVGILTTTTIEKYFLRIRNQIYP